MRFQINAALLTFYVSLVHSNIMKCLIDLKLLCFMLTLGRVLMCAELSSVALNIESQSYSDAKVEALRIRFLKAESDYKEFRSANEAVFERVVVIWDTQFKMQSPGVSATDAPQYRALGQELRHLIQTNQKLFDENRRLYNEYDYALMLFTSAYGRSLGLATSEEVTLRGSLRSRLGFKQVRC